MTDSIRKIVKSIVDPLGAGELLRKGFVEVNHTGEHLLRIVRHSFKASDAVILAGSGRSGTTWLGDLISAVSRAQQIFEPLAPDHNSIVRELTGWSHPPSDGSYIRAYYLSEADASPGWNDLWLKILTGRYRTYWTDADRQFIFPDRYLVKEVWGNLMLGYVYKNFQPRIIHLVRHPCAVVASRMAVPWYASVDDILNQEELVETYLRPWIGEIEKEKDLIGAHAVWWAVENMVAVKQLSSRPHQFLFYEETVTSPAKIGRQLSLWLGKGELNIDLNEIAKKPSRMTQQGKNKIDPSKLLLQWKHSLSLEDQARIIRWAHLMGLDWYDLDPMPLTLQNFG